jgi:hypothetical protein
MSDTGSSDGYDSYDDYPESLLDEIDALLTANRDEESIEGSLPRPQTPQVGQPTPLPQPNPYHGTHVFDLVAPMNQNGQGPAVPNRIPDNMIDPIIHQYQAIADYVYAQRPPSPLGDRMPTSIEYEIRRLRRNHYEAAQNDLTTAQALLTAHLEGERQRAAAARHAAEAAAAAARNNNDAAPGQAANTNNNNNRRRPAPPAQPRGQGRRAQRNAVLHAAGLCVHCHKPNEPGSKKKGCPECRRKRSKATNDWRIRVGRRPGPRGGQSPPPAPGAGAAMAAAC